MGVIEPQRDAGENHRGRPGGFPVKWLQTTASCPVALPLGDRTDDAREVAGVGHRTDPLSRVQLLLVQFGVQMGCGVAEDPTVNSFTPRNWPCPCTA